MQVNFSEILLVLVVALIVIKPENLPGAVRTVMQGLRWIRHTSQKIKQEMEKPFDMFPSLPENSTNQHVNKIET